MEDNIRQLYALPNTQVKDQRVKKFEKGKEHQRTSKETTLVVAATAATAAATPVAVKTTAMIVGVTTSTVEAENTTLATVMATTETTSTCRSNKHNSCSNISRHRNYITTAVAVTTAKINSARS